MNYLVTGGAGFIGSAMVQRLVADGHGVVVIDAMTYAGNLDNIKTFIDNGDISFYRNDICDFNIVRDILIRHHIDVIINFAAESHVDNSINAKTHEALVHSNVNGVLTLLDALLSVNSHIRFHQVSTDEVYGVPPPGYAFVETDVLNPRNPYSATKAAAEHVVVAYASTYGVTASITRSCNNMGPRQHGEKLPMTVIRAALSGNKIPVYGDGHQTREWIHVDDHVDAICHVIDGRLTGIWNVGTGIISENNDTVSKLCESVDALLAKSEVLRGAFPQSPCSISRQRRSCVLVEHVQDRLGHDTAYHINSQRLIATGWTPRHTFEDMVNDTVLWSVNNLNSTTTYGQED